MMYRVIGFDDGFSGFVSAEFDSRTEAERYMRKLDRRHKLLNGLAERNGVVSWRVLERRTQASAAEIAAAYAE